MHGHGFFVEDNLEVGKRYEDVGKAEMPVLGVNLA